MVREGSVTHTGKGIVGRPGEADGEVLSVMKVANALISRFMIRWPGVQQKFSQFGGRTGHISPRDAGWVLNGPDL